MGQLQSDPDRKPTVCVTAMAFDPRNILIIDFGQLGDVVMSLPALRAVREKFPFARITVAVGKPAGEIVNMSGYADANIEVDRVAMRDGFKALSIARIFQVVKETRARQFDFVIDLHSFAETNLLGFLSGARTRLFSRRRGRSLDFLANFRPAPPVEEDNRKRHQVDRYLDVLRPLDISEASRVPRLATRPEDNRQVDKLLAKSKAAADTPLVGLFPGAGHESRRWPLTQFAQLADSLSRNDEVRPIVFVGPEEAGIVSEIRAAFPASAVVLDRLTIRQLASLQ
ncbi:MAG TPA: glycosyltransferase family 9 protein, partial [Pyrinomonadaceae bacterium]|nr:glycosyltransferase family 9 protein [Pyrinomonadaceae bacterium]